MLKSWPKLAGILLVLAMVGVACAGPGSGAVQGVNQGNQARDFTLETLEGAGLSLQDYRGKVVLLNFWATWCTPCRDEIPDIQAAYEAYQDDGFVVLGINVEESRQQLEPFVAELGITYPVLLDETGQVLKMYRAIGLPISVILDRDGVIQVRHVGLVTAAQLEHYLAELLPGGDKFDDSTT
jgi:cytochrome c biogenesis protein CcmG/thiol:disulfide interchange protein DsbE